MADDSQALKTIADNLEATYQSLRQAAANISGLLAAGTATCDEVKAYNAWALAIFDLQRGMLDTLRQGGEPNVPDLPAAPTLFGLNGVEGEAMLNIDCSSMQANGSLSGLMAAALRGPTENTVYLSSDQIKMITTDPYVNNPTAAPTYKNLLQVQRARSQSGLGIAPFVVLIVIAAVAVAVSVALVAIMSYLKASAADEANTQETRIQADTFAKYTNARLQCLQSCTASGKSVADCVSECASLITAPQIELPGDVLKKWGTLQWIGLFTVLGLGGLVAWWIYERRSKGESLLPSFPELPSLSGADDYEEDDEIGDYSTGIA